MTFSSATSNEIGVATIIQAITPYAVILSFGTGDKNAGIRDSIQINQPAPKGKGKYSTQNVVGTVLKKRN